MPPTLAYGGFDFSSPDGDLGRASTTLSVIVLYAILAYIPASCVLQRCRRVRIAGLGVFIVLGLLLATRMSVMGQYGPAHVAMGIGIWAFPLLGALLIAKTCVLMRQDWSAAARLGGDEHPLGGRSE